MNRKLASPESECDLIGRQSNKSFDYNCRKEAYGSHRMTSHMGGMILYDIGIMECLRVEEGSSD